MRWDALRIAWSLGALPSIFCDSHGKSGTSIVFHLATFVDELLRASMVHATTAFAIAAAQNTCLETLWHKYKQSKHVRTKMGVVGPAFFFQCLTSQYFFKHSDFLHLQPMLCPPVPPVILGLNASAFLARVSLMAFSRTPAKLGMLLQSTQLQPSQ
jgi:hypothetical protein